VNNAPVVTIAHAAMITPVGCSAKMTFAAVEAGISRYGQSPFYNSRHKPMTAATVPEEALPKLNEKLQGAGLSGREKKIIRLGAVALEQAFAFCPTDAPVPLFLAGPEVLPNAGKPISAKILTHLLQQTDVAVDPKSSRYFATGRTGVLEAIELAFSYFSSTDAQYVLVGGVDSYLDAATLAHLDSEQRVLAEGITDGCAPGEGAAFLLLKACRSEEDTPKGSVLLHRPGLGVEPGHLYSETPYQGAGLTTAFRDAMAHIKGGRVQSIFSSMNGERFFTKEYGVACLRQQQFIAEDSTHIHPADCYGDMGSATGAVLLFLASERLKKQNCGGPSLVYCSSDLAPRAALCLSRV
jgi:3-oxoacyl-[acyl-carrier-protein] synthase-1